MADCLCAYAMRARNAANTAYVTWNVVGEPDPNGDNAPSAILPGSAVVALAWNGDVVYRLLQTTNFLMQSSDVPFAIDDPGLVELLVLVDTASSNWTGGGEVDLPFNPDIGALITVKDSSGSALTKPIVINGNGHTIDGWSTQILSLDWAALKMTYSGTEWRIV